MPLTICGIDEAGRGCLAGPVVSAAVIIDKNKIPSGIKDSKQLTELKRNEFYKIILIPKYPINHPALPDRL